MHLIDKRKAVANKIRKSVSKEKFVEASNVAVKPSKSIN